MSKRVCAGVLALLFPALGLVTGCVSKPIITLAHAELASASYQGLGLTVVLRVTNPNSYDVAVRNVHVQVLVAGRHPLAPINVQPNQWLSSNATSRLAVPVVIPWQVIPALVAETLGSPVVTYRVTGSVDVTAVRMLGIERNNYPVDEQGSLPRQVFIDASSGTVRF